LIRDTIGHKFKQRVSLNFLIVTIGVKIQSDPLPKFRLTHYAPGPDYCILKIKAPASTHKKVIVVLADKKPLRGYLNPARLGQADPVDVLTPDGEHLELPLAKIRSIYFVREFSDEFEPERKAFLSRPKLDGLWVRLRYTDGEALEGVVPNDLLSLLDNGLQITPPDLKSSTDRIFIPRAALIEVTVLGVVGIARRKSAAAAAVASQPRLFNE
jgi:hypothetical protein